MFLNPDTIVLDKAIAHMIHTLDSHPEAAAVGPRAYWDQNRQFLISSLKIPTPIQCWLTHSVTAKWASFHHLIRNARQVDWDYWTRIEPAFPVPAIGGAYLMVRRSAIDAVGGGFNPDYFLGYEDVDLCHQLSKKGYTLLCCPQAEIVHLYGASKRKTPIKLAHCLNWKTEARQFLVTHYGGIRAHAVGMLLAMENSIRFIRRLCLTAQSVQPCVSDLSDKADPIDITVSWPSTGAAGYLVEIATSPGFYDKFGHFTAQTSLTLSVDTQAKLTPGIYYWRVLPLPLGSHTKPIHHARFDVT